MSTTMPDLTIEVPFLPPSENNIRLIRVIRGKPAGLAYTREAANFKKDFIAHLKEYYFIPIQKLLKSHTDFSTYKVDIILWFPIEQLVNKGWPKTKTFYKRMDVGNRRKLLEDCLSECLGLDDSLTFELNMSKRAVKDGSAEYGIGIDIDVTQFKDGSAYGIEVPNK